MFPIVPEQWHGDINGLSSSDISDKQIRHATPASMFDREPNTIFSESLYFRLGLSPPLLNL